MPDLVKLHESIRTRKGGSRWGVGFASSYLKHIEATCQPTEVFDCSPDEWAAAMKKAESDLTYCDEASGIDETVLSALGEEKRDKLGRKTELVPLVKGFSKKEAEGACFVFDCTITTIDEDRDGDILEPKGAQIDMAGPLLAHHCPVSVLGKPLKLLQQNSKRVREREAIMDFPFGRDIAQFIEFKALRRMSHGFLPTKWEERKGGDEEEFPGWHFHEYEVMERSVVSVASNRGALIDAWNTLGEKGFHTPYGIALAKSAYDERKVVVPGCSMKTTIGDFSQELKASSVTDLVELNRAVLDDEDSGGAHAVDEDRDEGEEIRGTIPGNPSGGTGEGTDGDWKKPTLSDFTDKSWDNLTASEKSKISKHYAWKNGDKFADLHLPHHFASSGKASLNGVRNALARAGQVSGIGDDLEKVRVHLRAHLPKSASVDSWLRKDLGPTFDVNQEHLEPSKLEYDWVSRFIGCQVKHLFYTRTFIPSIQIGSWLTGLRELTRDYHIEDTRNIDPSGKERPPKYEVIQLNSKTSDDFLVDGMVFYSGSGRNFVINLTPDWSGLSVSMYTSTKDKDFNRELITRTWRWSKDHNFLKGEAFGLCGGFIDKTDERWDDLFLPEQNRGPVERLVRQMNSKGSQALNRGMILMGPPGTGKTLSARIVRNQAEATFIWVSARDFYHAGRYGTFMLAFDMARDLAPSIICFEDVDNWMDNFTEDLLKTEMDGMSQSKGVATILTTNYPERIPDSLIDRPGRFHDVLAFDLPDLKLRQAMLKRWLPEASDVEVSKAAKRLEGYSGAHLHELARYAKTIQEEEELSVGDALTKAIEKVEQQRELINSSQLSGSHHQPHRSVPAIRKHATLPWIESKMVVDDETVICADDVSGWLKTADIASVERVASLAMSRIKQLEAARFDEYLATIFS